MKHIIFKIFPASSHLNATFKLASKLSEKGHKITYAVPHEYEKEVVAQGFDYFPDKDLLPTLIPALKKPTIFKRISVRKEFEKFYSDYDKADSFANILTLSPDLLIIDSPYVRHAIGLFKQNIPFVIFESMVALRKRPFHPPLSSKIVPRFNWFYSFYIQFAWENYFISSWLENLLFGNPFPTKSKIKKLAKSVQLPIGCIDFCRYFHIGLKCVPELIASPYLFDFPHQKSSNEFYVGIPVETSRKESSFDYKFLKTREHIKLIKQKNENSRFSDRVALIYCSFGSMSWRYEGVKEFYEKLINVFENKRNVILLISTGSEMSSHLFKNVPHNIHVFQRVPQLEVLKSVDLMITHGGMNTITECILSEVPMLVYPGTKKIDQVGNACRVVYHKIGLSGDLKTESENMINKKVDELLKKKFYKENICKLKASILDNNESTDALNVIEQLLQKTL